MKRFHVHVGVTDLEANIRFYSNLFGAAPTVHKPDYAKWMIDEPRINFAISAGGREGVSHLGLEGDSADELATIRRSFAAADPRIEDEPDAACCHARSDKHWATDPQGIRWEAFHSRGLLEDEPVASERRPSAGACCAAGMPAHEGHEAARSRCCG